MMFNVNEQYPAVVVDFIREKSWENEVDLKVKGIMV
jgi:hypothetical protein